MPLEEIKEEKQVELESDDLELVRALPPAKASQK